MVKCPRTKVECDARADEKGRPQASALVPAQLRRDQTAVRAARHDKFALPRRSDVRGHVAQQRVALGLEPLEQLQRHAIVRHPVDEQQREVQHAKGGRARVLDLLRELEGEVHEAHALHGAIGAVGRVVQTNAGQ